MNRKIAIIFLFLGCFVVGKSASAGFGISPPYVKSTNLTKGAHYEQTIYLLRSSAEEALIAELVINAPEVEPWISFDQGDSFELPKDQLRTPMVVKIDVPEDADIDNYKGHINIRVTPKNENRAAGVAIALGARIDVDITLTEERELSFEMRDLTIQNFEELKFPWNLKIFSWFFYRLRVIMKIENTGNTAIAPSKVALQVYDAGGKNLIGEFETDKIKEVEPFQISETIASMPVNLPAGQYFAKIKVYVDNDIIKNQERTFTISPPGGLGDQAPRFGVWPYLLLLGYIVLLLIVIGILIALKAWKYFFAVFYYLLGIPILFILKQLNKGKKGASDKFWKYMHQKSSNRFKDRN